MIIPFPGARVHRGCALRRNCPRAVTCHAAAIDEVASRLEARIRSAPGAPRRTAALEDARIAAARGFGRIVAALVEAHALAAPAGQERRSTPQGRRLRELVAELEAECLASERWK